MQKVFYGRLLSVEVFVEPRDIWIGLYWKRYPKAIDVYVCFLPMLPIKVYFQWGM